MDIWSEKYYLCSTKDPEILGVYLNEFDDTRSATLAGDTYIGGKYCVLQGISIKFVQQKTSLGILKTNDHKIAMEVYNKTQAMDLDLNDMYKPWYPTDRAEIKRQRKLNRKKAFRYDRITR